MVKRRKSGADKPADTASVKSAGARSLVASLYSLTIGGQRVKKRRRPDFSTLGAPEWYTDTPPLPPDMPGTVWRTTIPAYSIAHGTVLPMRLEDKNHWLSLILYNHASESSLAAMYHNEAKVMGEVRLNLEKAKSILSLEVWLTAGPYTFTAVVWNRQMGDPRKPSGAPGLWKDKFPVGSYVFPFELPPFPRFVRVVHPDNNDTRTGLVPLPPSGKIKYSCGVGIRRDSVAGINEDMDMVLQYIPLTTPVQQPPVPFPFLASREDWPFKRETIGGWVLSPFGGRGRVALDVVEVEGLLGVRDPSVVMAGQKLEFIVILWSKSADALALLAQPAAVEVSYNMADFMPSSEVLRPREQSRQTRTQQKMATGRIWDAETGRPVDGAAAPQLVTPEHIEKKANAASAPLSSSPSSISSSMSTGSLSSSISGSPTQSRIVPSRMQSLWSAESSDEEDEEDKKDGAEVHTEEFEETAEAEDGLGGLPDEFEEPAALEHFARLEGEIVIPPCRPVSYRYTEVGREYSLELRFSHPLYSHISPTGPGIYTEVPLWYVADRPMHNLPAELNDDPTYLESLPLKGATIPTGPETIRWPKTKGRAATAGRGGLAKLGQPFLGLVPPKEQAPAARPGA
uniref:Arrestin-like N-terminal domain-containing protein n=1 Tax=Mycena chlorophos TaxID=658473 RepID=A0ABQ0LZK9_MYCCL|nr:predicted protein [Mycena chlorophos]